MDSLIISTVPGWSLPVKALRNKKVLAGPEGYQKPIENALLMFMLRLLEKRKPLK